jgi:RHS repeat-associated protein
MNWTAKRSKPANCRTTQHLAARYRYDPYGNTISSSGTLASANTYRFSSKEVMPFGGGRVYYYGYRFYDANLQRWFNRDPIGERGGEMLIRVPSNWRTHEEKNLYAFVDNAPVSNIDSHGLYVYWPQSNPEADPFHRLGRCAGIARNRLNEFRERSRQGLHGPDSDKWFHCVVSCELARACGPAIAFAFTEIHEILHPGGRDDTRRDRAANQIGRNCGDCEEKRSCEQCCEDNHYRR